MINNFELRAAAAKLVRTSQWHAEIDAALHQRCRERGDNVVEHGGADIVVESFRYQGDGTTTEAVDKEKLHVSKLSVTKLSEGKWSSIENV